MKKTRYSDEQIVRILRETDKDTVAEVAKRHGVSEATIYAWRKKFGSMETDEVKRLKALEGENARNIPAGATWHSFGGLASSTALLHVNDPHTNT
ncbi:Transposase [Pollutimonas bauzanensis]|uniref:Transposase n=1 Tax=Pollutimonas bauzanensis TaxID=658167 RepID=A0A1M5Q266_9BURK|nr:Transposase [Pollutimonas bauzanensis]